MDAKAEAEKRYPWPNGLSFAWVEEEKQHAFLAGAAWALRQFGDLIGYAPEKRDEWHEISRRSGHTPEAWRTYAHHIADEIEDRDRTNFP